MEQEIIDLLLASLKLCDTETQGSRQFMYIIRSGLIYHNLGNIYRRAYKLENMNDVRKKKLLQLARLYYEKGSKTFESIDAPIEYLAVQIDRLDLHNMLFDGMKTTNFMKVLSSQTANLIFRSQGHKHLLKSRK